MSKTILITGASTGFGRDTAETLTPAGHTVIASVRNLDGNNAAHASALRRQGIAVVELDVTDASSIERAVGAVLAKTGRIDVLVNNAGIAAAGITEAFTPEQTQAVFDVNFFGLLRVTRAVLPGMRTHRDGLIVNIGSILGRVTFPFFGLYGASKFAVEALSDSLRYELSPLGIEVALVQPSAYPTPLYASVQHPHDAARSAAYGATAEIPGAMFKHFMGLFEGPNAPNAHDVAAAVERLVALPKGGRPARTIVGNPFGADLINRQTAPVQAGTVAALGLGHLDQTPLVQSAA